jgi:hypothetical protein
LKTRVKGKVKDLETRIKMSRSKTGIKMSEETKLKMSEAHKGKILSVETKRKMSEAETGKHRSAETRAKMGAAKKGVIKSEETKVKISESNKGKIPWNKDLQMPTIQVANMSKKVNQLSLHGALIKQWSSQSEASRTLKISVGNISQVCSGKRNMTGGFKWENAN